MLAFLRGIFQILKGDFCFYPRIGGGRMQWDVAVGGLWEEDLKNLEKEFPGYEVVDTRSEDGHHYTAYLRKKRR